MSKTTVDSDLVGAVWPTAHPGEDKDSLIYGRVDLHPKGAFETRSLQTFHLVYTVGRYGIDDTGSIRVVFRFVGDGGAPQTSNQTGYDYVSAHTNTDARIVLDYNGTGHQRPWFKSLTARLHGGYLSEGDTITIVFGDTSHGSPGIRMQTFCEAGFEFKVLVDVCAVGHYVPLPETPAISIVPGKPHIWRAVLPTLRRPGERFCLGLKAEDQWGNPTDLAEGSFRVETNLSVEGLPDKIDYPLGTKAMVINDLRVVDQGVLKVSILNGEECLAEAGPLLIREGKFSGYWGDMHGQSGESIGVGTARQYFDFARDKAFLDVCSHQANDFQIKNDFWDYLNGITAEYQEDGRFVTFPGFEWSGNTPVGGDRNVFFRNEGRQIHRSSHGLLSDRSDINTDAPDVKALFKALENEDSVVYAHVGGRYADIEFAHDPRLETAMEIHSSWGTFEWMLTDGFRLGHRSGLVCNSDGHKGRPGASYPGTAKFGSYGGLTCFLAEELTRDSIFKCLRHRHHYGTTGCRLHLDVQAHFAGGGQLFERDPDVYADTPYNDVSKAIMGDIVKTGDNNVKLSIEVAAHAPIERIEVRNGTERIEILRPYAKQDLGSRIRVIWSGAEYRGRGRQTTWIGRVRFNGSSVVRIVKFNIWNPEHLLAQRGSDTVEWNTLTTGNFGGFDAYLDEGADSFLDLACNHGTLNLPLAEIGLEDSVMEAGGLDRKIRVFRLPNVNQHCEIKQNITIPLRSSGDNPLWVCITTEDGFQAWSSPIFVFR
jgi:hypothetical protein